MSTEPPDEIPIPDASQASGVPKRTIYRWVGSGRLKARTADGVQVVSVEAVRALAAARDATGEPGKAVPRAGTSVGTGTQVALVTNEGAIAAKVFAAFRAGSHPSDVVEQEELPPRLVADLWKQFRDLQSAGAPGRPSVADEIAELKSTIAALRDELEAATQGGTLSVQHRALAERVEEIATVLAALPIPPRERFTCSCGNTGWVALHAQCTVCKKNTTWGFHAAES